MSFCTGDPVTARIVDTPVNGNCQRANETVETSHGDASSALVTGLTAVSPPRCSDDDELGGCSAGAGVPSWIVLAGIALETRKRRARRR